METYPNFFVIGAFKAGTTSLHHYLIQHPDIYMLNGKETYFFNFMDDPSYRFKGPGDDEALNKRVVRSLEEYKSRFSGKINEKMVGEICGSYLYDPQVPERIHRYNPNAKLLAILRNPVDRAYSAYMHVIREGHEKITDFEESMKHEKERIRKQWRYMWHFTQMSLYYEQVKRYVDRFDHSQIRIYLFEEDFKKTPHQMMKDIFTFLEVDNQFEPNMVKQHNITGLPKSRLIRSIVDKPNIIKSILRPLMPATLRRKINNKISNKNLSKPPLSPEVRQKLVLFFQDDILKLQDLINRDLSIWMQT